MKLKDLEGVGRTKATKLLARKRPRIALISNSVVEKFYGLAEWAHLRPLRQLLGSNVNYVKRIMDLVDLQTGYVPSVLQILDISIWMTGSNSRAAHECRKKIRVLADTRSCTKSYYPNWAAGVWIGVQVDPLVIFAGGVSELSWG